MSEPTNATPVPTSRILVVDDESATRMMARAMLERRGHQVAEATDGAEALETVRGNAPFDAVLMDVNMPGVDGLAALDAIRRLDDPARGGGVVIMLTASPDPDAETGMIERGADAVLRKPLRWDTLAPVLSRCLATAGGDAGGPEGTEPTNGTVSPVDRILADLPTDRARHLLERAVVNLRAYHGEISAAGRGGDAAETSRLAHKIAGVAGTYGCPALARAAAALELESTGMSPADLARAVTALAAPFDAEVGALERRAAALL